MELLQRSSSNMPNGVPMAWMAHAPVLPTNAVEARATFDLELFNLQRLYMANRGVWDAVDSAGPACGIATTEEHVDRYLEVLNAFLDELAGGASA